MTGRKTKQVANNILKEIKIKEERVGFLDELGRIAVLNPKELIERQHQPMYDQKVRQLEDKGYRVIYTPPGKPKKSSRDHVYDILERL